MEWRYLLPLLPSNMRIIKYFFEEPTLLDFPASESGEQPSEYGLKGLLRQHRHYRGYLAASDLGADTIGGSALEDHTAARVLASILTGPIWFSNRAAGQTDVTLSLLTGIENIVRALAAMASDSVMMMDVDPTEEMVRALTDDNDQKVVMRKIAQLLDAGCTLVFPNRPIWDTTGASFLHGRWLPTFGKRWATCPRKRAVSWSLMWRPVANTSSTSSNTTLTSSRGTKFDRRS